MENSSSPKPAPLLGILLILAALIGLVLSLVAVAGTWRYRGPVTQRLTEEIGLVEDILLTTKDVLLVTDQSLTTAISNTKTIESALTASARSIRETRPLVRSLSTLMGDELPTTIQATVTSLRSAQASAQIIETFLIALSSVPLVPEYSPEVPLYVSLEEVAISLEDLPDDLGTLQGNLDILASNLTQLNVELLNLARDVRVINAEITNAQTIIEDYQQIVTRLTARTGLARENLDRLTSTLAWVLTGFFFWLGITQIGLLAQGLWLVRGRPK